MFTPYSNALTAEPFEGVTRRVLAHDDDMMLVEFSFKAGVELPLHSHPHKQISCVVSGKMEFTMGGEVFIMNPGDSMMISPDVTHGAKPLEDSVVVDIFSPARKDFL